MDLEYADHSYEGTMNMRNLKKVDFLQEQRKEGFCKAVEAMETKHRLIRKARTPQSLQLQMDTRMQVGSNTSSKSDSTH